MKTKMMMIVLAALLCAGVTACGTTAEPTADSTPTEVTTAEITETATETEETSTETKEADTTAEETAAETTEAEAETTAASAETTAEAASETAADTSVAAEETTGPRFKGEDYLGTWGSGRCTITIEEEGDGYLVQVQWAGSAAEGSQWTYHCTYRPETWHLHCDGTGVRTDYKYDAEGADPEETVVYTNGSAEFWHSDDGYLGWTDLTEHVADDMYFEK